MSCFGFCLSNRKNNTPCLFPNVNIDKRDAFQYNGDEILWFEWWTLYCYGTQNAVNGMFNYIFYKTANEFGSAIIYPAIVSPDNQKRITTWDTFPIQKWQASTSTTDVKIGEKNMFQKQPDGRFKITGELKHENLIWDLTFEPKSQPLDVAKDFELFAEQRINFSSLAPTGSLKGIIHYKNVEYIVDCYGEVEHIWGPLVIPTLTWQLVHGCDSDFKSSIYFFNVPERGGAFMLELPDKKRLYWKTKDLTVNHEFRQEFEYPVKTTIVSEKHNMNCTIQVSSISASNPNNASENHVFIQVQYKESLYKLQGMAEFHKANATKMIEHYFEKLLENKL